MGIKIKKFTTSSVLDYLSPLSPLASRWSGMLQEAIYSDKMFLESRWSKVTY
jgi:hypothetical protein